jgi:Protein of unknown function (DUF2726)
MNAMLLVILVLVAASTIGMALKKTGGSKRKGSFGRKSAMSRNEQAMYWRLIEALPPPEYVVFGQVSLGALLTAKEGASRYSFSQKRADFVAFDKSFKVAAVIELDDASHDGREDQDGRRDEMLAQAGYKVLRYRGIPQREQLKRDVEEGIKRP